MIERDWIILDRRPRRSRKELEARVEELEAALVHERGISAALCAYANGREARVSELSRSRREKVDRSALYAELPLAPTVEQKKAAAAKHGISLHQVNKLLRERGTPVRVRGGFSRDL